jgi:dephospho-CoA kinase
MPFRVVLTGGIASGKTAAAAEFEALGVPVIDTDQINREILAPGTDGLAKIVAAFGHEMLDSSGNLDRARMRERVFSNPEQRKKLESITHPVIREELARRAAIAQGTYQIHAIPLYAERGAKGDYDRVLVIDSPEDVQLKRLLLRDGTSAELGRKILAAQVSRTTRLAVADDIIENLGSLEDLRVKVRNLHAQYLTLAASKPPS